jgi:hypothetical protein
MNVFFAPLALTRRQDYATEVLQSLPPLFGYQLQLQSSGKLKFSVDYFVVWESKNQGVNLRLMRVNGIDLA